MWNPTPALQRLLRIRSRKATDDSSMGAGSEAPDLFRDNEKLDEITRVRDAVRSLRREARTFDEESELSGRSCEADLQRYLVGHHQPRNRDRHPIPVRSPPGSASRPLIPRN